MSLCVFCVSQRRQKVFTEFAAMLIFIFWWNMRQVIDNKNIRGPWSYENSISTVHSSGKLLIAGMDRDPIANSYRRLTA